MNPARHARNRAALRATLHGAAIVAVMLALFTACPG